MEALNDKQFVMKTSKRLIICLAHFEDVITSSKNELSKDDAVQKILMRDGKEYRTWTLYMSNMRAFLQKQVE